jgi:tRNA U54 and U55 pseudouridine synthase Pus10
MMPIFCGIFLVGRYNKFSRTLSQTPWVIDGERRMESSVQEIISESLQAASKAESNFCVCFIFTVTSKFEAVQ